MCPVYAIACLNVYHGLDQAGNLHHVDEHGPLFHQNFNLPLIEKKLKTLQTKLDEAPDYQLLSDFAVLLMKAGQADSARNLLQALYREHPSEYQLAANLGTAYELTGQLDSAFRYIKRGIELNPNAHEGSEWIHLEILTVKKRLNAGMDQDAFFSLPPLSEKQKQDPSVRKQLLIQIQERFPFSPPPNQIMAALLISLGDCYAASRSIEYAKAIYTLSEQYFAANPDSTRPRIQKMLAMRAQYRNRRPERSRGIETNVKITGVPYRDLLVDHQQDPYSIQWDQFNLNTVSLLALVNIKAALPEAPSPSPEPKVSTPKSSGRSSGWPYLLSALFGFVAIGLTLWRVNVLLSRNKD